MYKFVTTCTFQCHTYNFRGQGDIIGGYRKFNSSLLSQPSKAGFEGGAHMPHPLVSPCQVCWFCVCFGVLATGVGGAGGGACPECEGPGGPE